jgi:hypothetical protein
MKRSLKFMWIAVGFFLASVLMETTPVFSIGFWRLAAASECDIMGTYNRTSGERLLSRIVCTPMPEFSLRILYTLGSNQAQVYAIHGLGIIGSPYYQKYIDEFAGARGRVNMRAGSLNDLVSKKEVSEMIKARPVKPNN